MNPALQPADAVSANALVACIERLEDVLDLENIALVERRDADLQDCSRRKSRALLELTRIARALPPSAIETNARAGIGRLREKLIRNRDLLQIHISAVREVADLLARVISDTESDGTYSARTPARVQ